MELISYRKKEVEYKGCKIYLRGITQERKLAAGSYLTRDQSAFGLYQARFVICDAGITNIVGITDGGNDVRYAGLTDEIVDTLGGMDFLKEIHAQVMELSELGDSEKN